MLKVFISQPMGGKSDAEIRLVRRGAEEAVRYIFRGCDCQMLQSYAGPAAGRESGRPQVRLLARAIDQLAEADVAYFCRGWKNARGCRIEHEICEEYGIQALEESI